MRNFNSEGMHYRPLVTIMIPTYRQQDYIVQCVTSAINQTYPNLEVVVSDDGPDSTTLELLSQFMSLPNFHYYQNLYNHGRLGNYKRLLYELAKGDYVLMLDGDDYLLDCNYIMKSMDVILNNSSVVYVKARHTRDDTQEPFFYPLLSGYQIVNGRRYAAKVKRFISDFSHLSSLYNRTFALKYEFYRFNDVYGFFLLAQCGDICLFDSIAGVWRKTDNNASENIDKESLEGAFGAVDELLKKKILSTNQAFRMRMHYFLNYLSILKGKSSSNRNKLQALHEVIFLKAPGLRNILWPYSLLLHLPDRAFFLFIKVLLKFL